LFLIDTRFTTKAQEFEQLKADVLEKLSAYQQALQQATYEDLKNPDKGAALVNTYANLVASNAAFRAFLTTDKLNILLSKNII